MDISAPDEPVSLMTAGIHVSGNRLHGDRVHNQLFTLPDEATSLAIVADGSMPELTETAAAWFEGVLARPIVRHEWLRFGRVYAQEYLFADTLETLCQMFNGSRAPRWKTRWLGQGRRDGWIQVRCLGSPDRITHVRPSA
ncbi:hypothetical protein [Nonomuraea sp. NPDC023979]|uniref:hypothetical protein n=1 Tax=Nonomuraea sp. NPDC023979 TaxID=3154796 RepID=UPI0033E320AD